MASLFSKQQLYVRLFRVLPRKLRFKYIGNFVFALLAAIVDLIAITTIVPFIFILISPEKLDKFVDYLSSFLPGYFSEYIIIDEEFIKLWFPLALLLFTIIASLVRSLYSKSISKFSFDVGNYLSSSIFNLNLEQELQSQLIIQEDELVTLLTTSSFAVSQGFVLPLFRIMGSLTQSFIIAIALLFFSPISVIFIAIMVLLVYRVFSIINKRRILANSKKIVS